MRITAIRLVEGNLERKQMEVIAPRFHRMDTIHLRCSEAQDSLTRPQMNILLSATNTKTSRLLLGPINHAWTAVPLSKTDNSGRSSNSELKSSPFNPDTLQQSGSFLQQTRLCLGNQPYQRLLRKPIFRLWKLALKPQLNITTTSDHHDTRSNNAFPKVFSPATRPTNADLRTRHPQCDTPQLAQNFLILYKYTFL